MEHANILLIHKVDIRSASHKDVNDLLVSMVGGQMQGNESAVIVKDIFDVCSSGALVHVFLVKLSVEI
jgi:hypothetical protein